MERQTIIKILKVLTYTVTILFAPYVAIISALALCYWLGFDDELTESIVKISAMLALTGAMAICIGNISDIVSKWRNK